MNSRCIKIIALVTMTLDHIGYMLYPDIELFRILGRIAMPLFAFLIAYGATKTRNTNKYFLRLFLFAIAIQMSFNIFEGNLFAYYNWNIFFTLSFGVLAVMFIKRYRYYSIPLVLATLGLAYALPIDYGIHGVLLIILFYFALRHSLLTLKITAVFSIAIFCLIFCLQHWWSTQWYALIATAFIVLFKDQKLKIHPIEKWAFYIYYPLHFIIIFCIGMIWF